MAPTSSAAELPVSESVVRGVSSESRWVAPPPPRGLPASDRVPPAPLAAQPAARRPPRPQVGGGTLRLSSAAHSRHGSDECGCSGQYCGGCHGRPRTLCGSRGSGAPHGVCNAPPPCAALSARRAAGARAQRTRRGGRGVSD